MLAKYLWHAHWAVFAAGVFALALTLISQISWWMTLRTLDSDRAFHDTYYVMGPGGQLQVIGAIVLATFLICLVLRLLARWAEQRAKTG